MRLSTRYGYTVENVANPGSPVYDPPQSPTDPNQNNGSSGGSSGGGYTPDFETITIQVGQDQYGNAEILMGDGSTVWPSSTGTGGSVQIYYTDNVFLENYAYTNYTAYIDVNLGYTISNWGQPGAPLFNPPTNVTDPYFYATINLTGVRANDSIYIVGDDGSSQWPSFASGATSISSGYPFANSGDNTQVTQSVATLTITFDTGYGFTLYDQSQGDSQWFPSGTTFADLSQWWPQPAQLNLNISATRWEHAIQNQIQIHSISGDSFPVTPGALQGSWSPVQSAQFNFANVAWAFSATSSFRPGCDWWLFDAATNEALPIDQSDTSAVIAADAALDSSHNGLPDWYKFIIGTNPFAFSTVGDGISDGWLVLMGLNPLDPSLATNTTIWQAYTLASEPLTIRAPVPPLPLYPPYPVPGPLADGAPQLSPGGGVYGVPLKVTLTASGNSPIHYTLNGLAPTANDPSISSGQTVMIAAGPVTLSAGTFTGLVANPVATSSYNIVAFACAGGSQAAATQMDGTLVDWGQTALGQLGEVPAKGQTYSTTPVLAAANNATSLAAPVAVAVGSSFTMTVMSDNSVWAFGNDFTWQLGSPPETTTTTSTGLRATAYSPYAQRVNSGTAATLGGIVAVAAGAMHALALDSGGHVWAWRSGPNTLSSSGSG